MPHLTFDPVNLYGQKKLATPPIERRICKFCSQQFQPHRGSNPKRDWCYDYRCEFQKELEQNSKVAIAQNRRNAQKRALKLTNASGDL